MVLAETVVALWRPRVARAPYPRRWFFEGTTLSRVRAPSSMARLRSGCGGTSSSVSRAWPHPMAWYRFDDALDEMHNDECAGRQFRQWCVHWS
jgi:hypothetical protein